MPALGQISVVDDDESVRESLQGLLRSVGFGVSAFDSAESFLESESIPSTECLILDLRMPGMSGIDLQRELTGRDARIPIIFVTAQCDEAIRSQVVAAGALACLCKPFAEQDLLEAVETALGGSSVARNERQSCLKITNHRRFTDDYS
ncbi:MAG TPA: response regulator [Chthoniobacter sp.]